MGVPVAQINDQSARAFVAACDFCFLIGAIWYESAGLMLRIWSRADNVSDHDLVGPTHVVTQKYATCLVRQGRFNLVCHPGDDVPRDPDSARHDMSNTEGSREAETRATEAQYVLRRRFAI